MDWNRSRSFAAVVVIAAGLVGGAPSAVGALHQDAAAQPDVQSQMQQGQQLVNQGNTKDAIPIFRAVTEAQPNHAGAWFFLGYALHMDGQLDEAIKAHTKAATFPPVAGTALYNLGCAHALKGNKDEAFAALRRAIDTGMPNQPQWEADTDLNSLRDDDRWQALMDRRAFDGGFTTALRFWVGAWECYSPSGQINGRNTLELRVGGHVIHESWTPEGGGPPGESWNWFDPATGNWNQVWVSGGGVRTHFVGTPEGKGVMFEGTQTLANGNTAKVRMHVRPIEGGRVRQTGTQYDEPSDSWQPRYDLIYVPKGEPFDGPGDASET